MLFRPSRSVLVSCFAWCATASAWGAESASVAQMQEKSAQYHQVLIKRPNPGVLFDRFYDAWLDYGTVETLETFLTEQCRKDHTAANHLLLAFFHLKHGRQVEAMVSFTAATKADPGSAAAWLYRAETQASLLAFDDAMASLEKIPTSLADAELRRRIASLRGRLLLRLDKRDAAIACWRSLAAQYPNDLDLGDEIIDVLVAEGLVDAAVSDSATLCAKTSDPFAKVRRQLRRAELIASTGQRAQAVEILDTLLESVAASSWLERETLAAMERLYRREDDITGLTKHLTELIAKMPTRIGVIRRLMLLQEQGGQFEEAVALSKNILDRSPGDRRLGEEHAALLVKAGKTAEALQCYVALRAAHPKDQDLVARHAETLKKAGQSAEAALKDYSALMGSGPAACIRVARLAQCCDLDAVRVLQAGVKESPDALELREELANLLFASKKTSEAVAVLTASASTANLANVVRLSRQLSTNKEFAAAQSLLQSRRSDFEADEGFISERCRLAIQQQDFAQALPLAQRLIDMANGPTALALAIDQAILCAQKAQKATEFATEIESKLSTSVRLRCLAACLAERAGDKEKADGLLKIAADDALVEATQIRILRARQDYAAAAALVEQRLGKPGGKTLANLRDAVELYQRSGDQAKALSLIPEWKKAAPGSTEATLTEVSLLMGLGRIEDALSVLRRASAKSDHPQDLNERLASLYAENGRIHEALRLRWRLYDDAENLDDKLAQIRQLAQQSRWSDQSKLIISRLEERRASNRQSIVPLLSLATVYQVYDENAKRRAMLLEASRLQGDSLHILWELAQLAQEDGEMALALSTLERALPLDTANQGRTTLGRIARLHFDSGDTDAGYATLERLIGAGDPQSAETMAAMMISQKDYSRAIRYLTPLVAQFPNDYRLRGLLVVASEEEGRLDEALEQLLSMMGMKEEIQRLGGKPRMTYGRQTYYDGFYRKLPAEVVAAFQLREKCDEVYSYRQNRSHYRGRYGYQFSPLAIPLPEIVTEIPLWTAAHLSSISQSLGLDENDARCQRRALALHGAGLGILESVMDTRLDYQNFTSAFLEKRPKDPIALAIALSYPWSGLPQLSLEQGQIAVSAFATQYPILATLGALAAGVNNNDAAMLQRAQDLLTGITNYDDTSAMLLFSQVGNETQNPLSASFAALAKHKLRAWFPEIRKKNCVDWMFVSLASAMATEGDPKAWLAFLEEHLAQAKKNPTQGGGSSSYGRSQANFLGPIPFPLQSASSIPGEILAALNLSDDRYGEKAKIPEPEVLLPLIPQASSPSLRILLALAAQADSTIDQEIAAAVKGLSPELDVLLLAAGRRAYHDDHEGASQALVMARFLPMDAPTRTMVDGALVHAAQNSKDEATQKAGREAALRLRQQSLPKDQRELLLSAMQALGLNKEAKQLEDATLAQNTNSLAGIASSWGSSSGRGSVSSLVPAKVSKLLLDEKKDEALTALVVALKPAAIQAMDYQNNISDNDLKSLNDLVKTNGFAKDLIKRLTPAPEAPAKDFAVLGRVFEFLGQDAEAEKAYTTALEKRADEPFVALRLMEICWTKPGEDLEQRLESLIAKVPKNQQPLLHRLLQHASYGYGETPEKIFAIAQTGITLLGSTPDAPRLDLDWADMILGGLVQEIHVPVPNSDIRSTSTSYRRGRIQVRSHGETRSLSPLYRRIVKGESVTDPLLVPIAQRQRALHDTLCNLLMNYHSQKENAFGRQLLIAQAEKTVSATTMATALDIFALPPQNNNQSQRYGNCVSFNNNDNDDDTPDIPRLEIFLVSFAHQHHDRAWLESQIANRLSDSRLKQRREALTTLMDFFFCPEDQFQKTCKETLAKTGPRQDKEAKFRSILSIYEKRKLRCDLSNLVLDACQDPKSALDAEVWTSVAAGWFEILAKRDPQACTSFSATLGNLLLGPQSEWQALITKHFKGRNNQVVSLTTPAGKVAAFHEILADVAKKKPYPAAACILADYFPDDKEWANNLLPYDLFRDLPDETLARNEEIAKRQKKILDLLIGSCFTAEIADFRGLLENDGESSLAKGISNRMHDEDFQEILGLPADDANANGNEDDTPDLTIRVRVPLVDRLPNTFGTGVIRALLEKKPATALVEHCGKYLTEIRAMSPQRRSDLVAIMTTARKREAQPAPITADGRAVWAVFQEGNTARITKTLASLMDAKTFKDLKVSEYQFDDFVGKLLGDLLVCQPEKAEAALEQACQLYAQSQRRSSDNDWLRSTLQNIPREALQSPSGLKLLMSASQRTTEPKLRSLPWAAGYALRESLSKHLKANDPQTPMAFATYCQELDTLGADPAGLWLPLFFEALEYKQDELEKTAASILPALQAGPASQAAAATIRLVNTLHTLRKGPTSATQGLILPPEVLAPFVATLPSMSPGLRTAWMQNLFEKNTSDSVINLPAVLVKLYVTDLKTGQKKNNRIDDSSLQSFLSSFLLQTRDEAWIQTARELVSTRLNDKNNSFSRHSERDENLNRVDLPAQLLSTALAAGDRALALRVIQAVPELGTSIGTFAALVAQGALAEAKRLFHANALSITAWTQGRTWNAELAKALPELVGSIEIPTEKLLIQALLLGIPDAKHPDPALQNRQQRLTAFLQANSTFTGKALYDLNILAVLASEPSLASSLESRLKPIVEDLDPAAIGSNADPLNQARRQVLLASYRAQLARGDQQALEKALAGFPDTTDNDSWRKKLAELPMSSFKDQVMKGAPVSASQVQHLLSQCTAKNRFPSASELMVLLVATGHGDQALAWQKGLSAADQKALKKGYDNCDVFCTLGALVGTRDGVVGPFVSRRADIIVACLCHEAVVKPLSNRSLFDHGTGHDCMKNEELVSLGPRMCAGHLRGTKMWYDLAKELTNTGQTGALCEVWTTALQSASTPALRSDFTLELLSALRSAGRDPEAVTMAQTIDTKDWTEAAKAKLIPFFTPAPQETPISATKPASILPPKPRGIIP